MNVADNYSISRQESDISEINELLALGVDSPIDFGEVDANKVSDEITMEITNYGNIMMNLSLSGFGETEEDGNAMNCESGNISIEYEKFNITNSNSSEMVLDEFENNYQNLSSSETIKKFNLDYRKNDLVNEATNGTYWRIYIPKKVYGSCQGNIVFGAVQANEN